MSYDHLPKLSSKKDDLIYVMCLDCEILRKLEYADLMHTYGDAELISLKGPIAKEIVKCGKGTEGYRNRCRLSYYEGHGTQKIPTELPPSPKLEYLCSWEIVVGKCRYCGHVSNLERWRVSKVTKPGMTLDDLKKLLRCKRCNRKGDVELTLAKLPR
ncbi:hypothetical protein RMS29_023475 [Agrobacterium rosae]|uniref:Uncharacterized protein n=1 Tax=Agrobacterium rosae TaxID=1972867 RepID=A0AAE5RZV1_9HYPH|nr:hypothetical protein [Agrobacterium rosae]KAA3509675.1 hypothetical protein DXM21_21715 [Agrobacterium rosae]KAA3516577.1 hypothetical protein DXM25_19925 [Agrobacterium rosae]MCM2435098.1 hypothetical protein [Agrobacterium rosae]MDX8330679.1 hypothetical protein [Agrobacterium rosae]MQB50384.1 hypothetical protein [Agrobacterium rosae]